MSRLRAESLEPSLAPGPWPQATSLRSRRESLVEQIRTLSGLLSATAISSKSSSDREIVDLEAVAKEAAEAEAAKQKNGDLGNLTKTAVGLVKRMISGFMTIYLYFLDLISDTQVTLRP